MPAITCCLPPSLKAFLPTVEKWEGLEQASGHQCWLPLHSGSIPPPASHYLADREPLEPHLDGVQPRGGPPTCRRQQNPSSPASTIAATLPFLLLQYKPQTTRAPQIAQTTSSTVYPSLGCLIHVYQTLKTLF